MPALHQPSPVASSRPASALNWLNRYARLGADFCRAWPPDSIGESAWVASSDSAAAALGWPADWTNWDDALAVFSGAAVWPGMEPIVTVYSGHQFGVWAGQLGDGRALLLGEAQGPQGSWEIQLKGAGRTPYSRMGDGRAVLRSSIREFLCSEAMHGLGIPTTRALCLTASPMPVRREAMETAAVVARLAPSFVRFGHFEHFAFSGRVDELRRLADHVIAAHLPACAQAESPYLALLEHAVSSTAKLMASWQAVGFCHGVMNTDNMSILGLTLDYGPYGFLDAFNPEHICNHSDDGGRYAYQNQPQVAWWNLHMLARALLPLIDDQPAIEAALQAYKPAFGSAMLEQWRRKFGLETLDDDAPELIDEVMHLMAANRVDYTIFFRRLCEFSSAPDARNDALRDLFIDRTAFDAWAARYAQVLRRQASSDARRGVAMKLVNPKYILRNHLAEVAIRLAQQGDFSEVQRLLRILQKPFDEQPEFEADAGFPPDWAAAIEVSCSS